MNIKKSILFNAKISFLVVVLFSSLIIYRIFILQFKEGSHWDKIYENMNLSLLDIKANRGIIMPKFLDGILVVSFWESQSKKIDHVQKLIASKRN